MGSRNKFTIYLFSIYQNYKIQDFQDPWIAENNNRKTNFFEMKSLNLKMLSLLVTIHLNIIKNQFLYFTIEIHYIELNIYFLSLFSFYKKREMRENDSENSGSWRFNFTAHVSKNEYTIVRGRKSVFIIVKLRFVAGPIGERKRLTVISHISQASFSPPLTQRPRESAL